MSIYCSDEACGVYVRQTGVQVRGQHARERGGRPRNVNIAGPISVPKLRCRRTRLPSGERHANTYDAIDESRRIRDIRGR